MLTEPVTQQSIVYVSIFGHYDIIFDKTVWLSTTVPPPPKQQYKTKITEAKQ